MDQRSEILLINHFCIKDDLKSYDPYDIWKTHIGISVKKLFYRNKFSGIEPAGILTLFDLFFNNRFRLFYKKQEFPITRAQAALALMNLYEQENNTVYLKYAKKHIDWLLSHYSKDYNGYCWGLNFKWVYSAGKVYNETIPFSTHTPYPLEALVKYYHITNDKNLLVPIKSVFLFLENDLKIMKETKDVLIMSYGVEKDRIVANANSYIMYMYSLLIEFYPEKSDYIRLKINKIHNFIRSVQNEDGSWLYAPYDSNTFIDCFHSAFVLKNIYKTNEIVELDKSKHIIDAGYNYILDNFFDTKRKLFKRFTQSNNLSLTKFDLYDNAEMLSLAIILKDSKLTQVLLKSVNKTFVRNKKIASMIDITNSRKNFNYLRWAVMPYLLALSKLKETN